MKRPTSPGKNGRSRRISAPPAAIRVARRFRAPAERVFHAWLEPEPAGRWLFATAFEPMTDVEIDPRVGGSFRLAERRDNRRAEHAGRYVEIVPHRRLVHPRHDGSPARRYARDGRDQSLRTGCELALTHENVPPDRAGETEARWTGVLYGLGETLNSLPRRARAADQRRDVDFRHSRSTTGTHPEGDAVATKIFVNLPVKDLKKSIAFFTKLGFTFNPQFTDETATCMIVGEDIFVMLLTHAKFKTFTPHPICDATQSTEVLVCLSSESRERVDEMVRKAVAAGGKVFRSPRTTASCTSTASRTWTGTSWELVHMDPSAIKQRSPRGDFHARPARDRPDRRPVDRGPPTPIPRAEIQKVMGPGYREVMAAVAAQGIAPVGPWFTHHLRMDPDTFDFEIGVPVASRSPRRAA